MHHHVVVNRTGDPIVLYHDGEESFYLFPNEVIFYDTPGEVPLNIQQLTAEGRVEHWKVVVPPQPDRVNWIKEGF
jgi:hypothetical protein